MNLSGRSQSIQPSATLSISARASELQEEGVDVVGFGAGEPDFPTPAPIKQAGKKAIDDNFTGYTAASGHPDLKKAVVNKLKEDQDIQYKTEQVTIGCGAKHVLYNLMGTLLEPGDEALIFAPYWVSYPQQIRYFGGKPNIVDTSKNNFEPDPERVREAITDDTRLILVNSPSNPTGNIYSQSLLEELGQIAVEEDIFLISDEIYEKLIYGDNQHYSPAEFSEEVRRRTIIVNGVSKAYSMTGWRIGYAAGPVEVIEKVNTLMSHSTSNPCSISQKAAIRALELPDSEIAGMVEEFARRRDRIHELLNDIPGVECQKPQGAFYAFPDVSGLIENKSGVETDMQLAARLLDDVHVATVPGTPFGAPGFMRLSYANSMERIEEGVSRIADWV
ncbi:MAG: pyridoxal phosphate-dependent aminotransferase [bacterium]